MLIEESNGNLLELFELVSIEADKEKGDRPPISKMLFYPTRKPLITARSVLLASILKENQKEIMEELLYLRNGKRPFLIKPDKDKLDAHIGKKVFEIRMLDPFAGAGSLVFEASRLGVSCSALDYNPVAYILLKATVEYPSKFGKGLVVDVRKYGEELIKRTYEEVGYLFERKGKPASAYIWMWCISCPFCGQRIPLTSDMWLKKQVNRRKKPIKNSRKFRTGRKRSKVGLKLSAKDLSFAFEITDNTSDEDGKKHTWKDSTSQCINQDCKNPISKDKIIKDLSENKSRELVAVITTGSKTLDYEIATSEDKEKFEDSRRQVQRNWEFFIENDLIPLEKINENELYRLTDYGFRRWYEAYGERQLLVLMTLLKNIREIIAEIKDTEYAATIATYLSLLLCKHADYNSISTRWHSGNGQISDSLARRSPSFNPKHAEVNPFQRKSGSLASMLDDITDAIEFATSNNSIPEIQLGSCLQMTYNKEFDLIITDPPYVDDVAYGEITDFFYVWIKRVLKKYDDNLPDAIPLDEDLVVSRRRFGGDKVIASDFYLNGMIMAFKKINLALKDEGLLVVFFAHSRAESWYLLMNVLLKSGFYVKSSYALRTESAQNPLAQGKSSFMSSIVISCKKRIHEQTGYIEEIKIATADSIKLLLDRIDKKKMFSLPITDLLIMCYGRVLEEVTQYSKISSQSQGALTDLRSIIDNANEIIIKYVVFMITQRSPNIIGIEVSFYLIVKLFYDSIITNDDCLKLARIFNLDIDSLHTKKIIKKIPRNNDKQEGVKLLSFLEKDYSRTKPEELLGILNQLHYLESIAYNEGITRIKSILSYPNFMGDNIKDIIRIIVNSLRAKKISPADDSELKVLLTLSDALEINTDSSKNGKMDPYL